MVVDGIPKLSASVRAAYRLHQLRSKESLGYYLQHVVINSSPEPRRFGDCAEQWQRELIAPKIPMLEHLAGLRDSYRGPMSFMDILPRGHDKSSLEGRFLAWLLIASRRRINGYVIASDKDQGRLIIDAMRDETNLNPWVRDLLDVRKFTVNGPAGSVEIVPADAASAYGLRGNIYICDEWSVWPDQDVWKAVISGREKVQPNVCGILSNAGVKDSWQDEYRQVTLNDPDWVVFERPGQLASWMPADRVNKLRERLPPSEARRVFDNQWIDAGEDYDYIRRTEAEACAALGDKLGLLYRLRRQIGVDNYIVGMDYGPKRDRTVLVVLHLNRDHQIVIDRMDVWQGSPDSPVKVTMVEQWVREVQKAFNPKVWVCDPHQMLGTIQLMRDVLRLNVLEYNARGGAGNFEMAQFLRSMIAAKRIIWYPGCGNLTIVKHGVTRVETFVDELAALVVKRMPYGFRFDHENQRHDDRAVAVCMAALTAVDFPPSSPVPADPGLSLKRPPADA